MTPNDLLREYIARKARGDDFDKFYAELLQRHPLRAGASITSGADWGPEIHRVKLRIGGTLEYSDVTHEWRLVSLP